MSHSRCISLIIDLLLFWLKLPVEGNVQVFLFYVLWFYFISFQLQLGGSTFRKGLKHADRFWEGCQLLADRNVDVYLFTFNLIFFYLKWHSCSLDAMVMIKIEFVITIF